MAYSPEIIDEVMARNDIVDVIGSYVHLTKKGTNFFGLCPFHNEKTPSFSVSPSKQIYHCFGCGAGGDVFTFLENQENMSFLEAVKYLAERVNYTLPEETYTKASKQFRDERDRLFLINKEAASFYYRLLRSPKGRIGLNYLLNRRLNKNIMQEFGLGFSDPESPLWPYLKEKGFTDSEINKAGLVYIDEKRGMSDRFKMRVMFPIMDARSRVIGFGGRVMGDGNPKYLNSPETPIFDKGKTLYGFHIARKTRKKYLIACEGYMDVISLHQAGFSEAVASLGTAFTPEHARLIRRQTDDVRLSYDSDPAGIKAILRAVPILREQGISSKIIHLEPYKDPDEFIKNLGAGEFKKRIENAENSLSFEIHIIEKEHDMGDPESRTHFQIALAKRLSIIPEELERSNYTEAFASEYMIPSEALKRAVERYRLKGNYQDNSGYRERPVRLNNTSKRPKTDEGILKAEKLLLSSLAEDANVFEAVKPYLVPEDFSEGLCREAAAKIFQEMENGRLNPAAIVEIFENPEDKSEAAELLSASLPEGLSTAEKERALTDLVIKIKRASLNRMAGDEERGLFIADNGSAAAENRNSDPIGRLILEKRTMEKLSKIRISLGSTT